MTGLIEGVAPAMGIQVRDSIRSEVTTDLVRSIGYDAVTFGSTEDFLGSDCRGPVNCIIADIQMPGQSGLELQEALTAEPNSAPIIFLTGLPQEDPWGRTAEASSTCRLCNPVVPKELIRCIEDARSGTGQA